MRIRSLDLRNFRCFSQFSIAFDEKKVTILNGKNGSGKTSILEALYYLCYGKSFRAGKVFDLIKQGEEGFFIKLVLLDNFDFEHVLTLGCSPEDRLLQINNVKISSSKKLLDIYKVVAMTEDDIDILRGVPQKRRSFIDHSIVLADQSYVAAVRNYRGILEQRNGMLTTKNKIDPQDFDAWTTALIKASEAMRRRRKDFLENLERIMVTINDQFSIFDVETIKFTYKASDDFFNNGDANQKKRIDQLLFNEQRRGFSLIGAHHDDIDFVVTNRQQKKLTRKLLSRGQQKMVLCLMKVALLKILDQGVLFFIDDLIADFDSQYIEVLLRIIRETSNSHIICTTPLLDERYFNFAFQSFHVLDM